MCAHSKLDPFSPLAFLQFEIKSKPEKKRGHQQVGSSRSGWVISLATQISSFCSGQDNSNSSPSFPLFYLHSPASQHLECCYSSVPGEGRGREQIPANDVLSVLGELLDWLTIKGLKIKNEFFSLTLGNLRKRKTIQC